MGKGYTHSLICNTHDDIRNKIEKVMDALGFDTDDEEVKFTTVKLDQLSGELQEAIDLLAEAKSQGQDMERGLIGRRETQRLAEKELAKYIQKQGITDADDKVEELIRQINLMNNKLGQAVRAQQFLLAKQPSREATPYALFTLNRKPYRGASYRSQVLCQLDFNKKSFKIKDIPEVQFKSDNEFNNFVAQIKPLIKDYCHVPKEIFDKVDMGYSWTKWSEANEFFNHHCQHDLHETINNRWSRYLFRKTRNTVPRVLTTDDIDSGIKCKYKRLKEEKANP